MLDDGCVCALIPSPPLVTRTRLLLVTHYREDRRPTNTGRLATECLANAEVYVRGHRAESPAALPPPTLTSATRPLLLYPAADATELAPSDGAGDVPVTLIVPDGSWRQASKVRAREPWLAGVRCVTLPAGAPTAYHLRHEPKAGGLATMEAIARALAILEGPHIQAALELVFSAMVAATLRTRGHSTGDLTS